MCGRRLVLLDETLTGLDPFAGGAIAGQLARAANGGGIVLVASRDLSSVERVATRGLVLWSGRLVADRGMAGFLGERVAQLTLSGGSLTSVDQLLHTFRGATRTGIGADIPLRAGLTLESVLAACREERIPVAASKIRYRKLEELLRNGE